MDLSAPNPLPHLPLRPAVAAALSGDNGASPPTDFCEAFVRADGVAANAGADRAARKPPRRGCRGGPQPSIYSVWEPDLAPFLDVADAGQAESGMDSSVDPAAAPEGEEAGDRSASTLGMASRSGVAMLWQAHARASAGASAARPAHGRSNAALHSNTGALSSAPGSSGSASAVALLSHAGIAGRCRAALRWHAQAALGSTPLPETPAPQAHSPFEADVVASAASASRLPAPGAALQYRAGQIVHGAVRRTQPLWALIDVAGGGMGLLHALCSHPDRGAARHPLYRPVDPQTKLNIGDQITVRSSYVSSGREAACWFRRQIVP